MYDFSLPLASLPYLLWPGNPLFSGIGLVWGLQSRPSYWNAIKFWLLKISPDQFVDQPKLSL